MEGGPQGVSPTFYVLWAVLLLIVLSNVAMVIDTQRAKRRILKEEYNLPSEPLSLYAVLGGAFTIIALLGYLASAVSFLPEFVLLASTAIRPFMLLIFIVYLVRVVSDTRVHSYYQHYLERRAAEEDAAIDEANETVDTADSDETNELDEEIDVRLEESAADTNTEGDER